MKRSLFLLCLLIWLKPTPSFSHPAIDLYNQGIDLIGENKLSNAIEKFQQVQLMYPFSFCAMKAQLMSSFISYVKGDYLASASDAEKYIEIYSNSNQIEYAYYLLAMSYYKQIDTIERDNTIADQALGAFNEIILTFSESKYVRAAKVKRHEILNYLAAKEMNIGLFYLRIGNYIPAIGRFKNIISSYPETDYVPEATYRLTEVFNALNLPKEQEYYAEKLGENFPNNN
ncbi:MAG: outer membrane protein assembly factor BamD [Rickettsiaceae bacterium H1]|nr:outer membrane protein assembly factor BamD [Rickettsiaceae bacterium H1]